MDQGPSDREAPDLNRQESLTLPFSRPQVCLTAVQNFCFLMQFIKTAPVDQRTLEQALNLDYVDFEDAVQMISTVQSKVDCLVTHNVKDFQPALLPVMQPVDFLGTF